MLRRIYLSFWVKIRICVNCAINKICVAAAAVRSDGIQTAAVAALMDTPALQAGGKRGQGLMKQTTIL